MKNTIPILSKSNPWIIFSTIVKNQNKQSRAREASAWLRLTQAKVAGRLFLSCLVRYCFQFSNSKQLILTKKIQEINIKLIKARITTQHLSSNFFETFDTEDFLENRRDFIKMEEKRKL